MDSLQLPGTFKFVQKFKEALLIAVVATAVAAEVAKGLRRAQCEVIILLLGNSKSSLTSQWPVLPSYAILGLVKGKHGIT